MRLQVHLHVIVGDVQAGLPGGALGSARPLQTVLLRVRQGAAVATSAFSEAKRSLSLVLLGLPPRVLHQLLRLVQRQEVGDLLLLVVLDAAALA
eukprot:scaffold2448_cov250-Pinguiococcus_pyrenoidosus.AAC.18